MQACFLFLLSCNIADALHSCSTTIRTSLDCNIARSNGEYDCDSAAIVIVRSLFLPQEGVGGSICRPQWTFSRSRPFFHPRCLGLAGRQQAGGEVTKRPAYSSHCTMRCFELASEYVGSQEHMPVYSTNVAL